MKELESITTLRTKKKKKKEKLKIHLSWGKKCSFLNLCSTAMFCSSSYISTKNKLSGPIKGYLREMVDWDMWKGQVGKVS